VLSCGAGAATVSRRAVPVGAGAGVTWADAHEATAHTATIARAALSRAPPASRFEAIELPPLRIRRATPGPLRVSLRTLADPWFTRA
jgi:hypothetical protein